MGLLASIRFSTLVGCANTTTKSAIIFITRTGQKGNNQESVDSIKKYLQVVCDEVEEVLKGDIFGGKLDQVFEHTCEKCQQAIVVGKHTLEKTSHIICQNPNCKAEYLAQVEDEGRKVRFTLFLRLRDSIALSARQKSLSRIDDQDIGLEFSVPHAPRNIESKTDNGCIAQKSKQMKANSAPPDSACRCFALLVARRLAFMLGLITRVLSK